MPPLNILTKIRKFYGLSEQNPDIQWTKTDLYRRRLEQVKTGWIISGVLMLAVENVAGVMTILVFSGFMSLAFLERDGE